ncbi:MacB-like protein [Rhodothalassium salexigens DSM 2132]|uniref:MacB-like protein n=1 Tax=Rhodothalassium salexigens DSM 2132 TaxID=1188247 RepID=A0A4R2PA31_RHOSA|nr:ABC transporter permease [Rhodothalassium salexigens]MBB4212559.1 putative ABC transport system permease protein [Rhodothalassium salexigens DSM 2132]MBK1639904.1 hypothetical protein [Rhodothalassium salexigens DSM 2132]TCP31104.1 MacB-like protein [Rhodothalassium salexigens DSM 2132]
MTGPASGPAASPRRDGAAPLSALMTVIGINLGVSARRPGRTLAAVGATMIVVAAFLAFVGLGEGFQRTLDSAGDPQVAVVLSRGAQSESNSTITTPTADALIAAASNLIASSRRPASQEVLVVVNSERRDTGMPANTTLRGVTDAGYAYRAGFHLLAGRRPIPGENELIAGRAAARLYADLDPGATVRFGETEWRVVGLFATRSIVHESEIWTSVTAAQSLFRRQGQVQTVRLDLGPDANLEALSNLIDDDPRLSLSAVAEDAYFARQAGSLAAFVRKVGYPMAAIMAIGAIAGMVNSIHSLIMSRRRETGMMRAFGYRPGTIAGGIVVEALVLALIGGALGVGVAWLGFDGRMSSTLGPSFSQIVFAFDVSGLLAAQGMALALAIGLLGGLPTALWCARRPVLEMIRR